MHKTQVLHLFATHEETRTAFNFAITSADIVTVNRRNFKLETENAVEYFKHYTTYRDARISFLCGQWCEIHTYLDLPIEVQTHLMSRLRCHGPCNHTLTQENINDNSRRF